MLSSNRTFMELKYQKGKDHYLKYVHVLIVPLWN